MQGPFRKSKAERTKEAAMAAQADRLDTILLLGNEEEFVAMVKAADPKITPEKLLELIQMYRAARQQRTRRGV